MADKIESINCYDDRMQYGGCYNRLTATLEASLDEEDWQDVRNPLGTTSKYCEAGGVNAHRSARLGSI